VCPLSKGGDAPALHGGFVYVDNMSYFVLMLFNETKLAHVTKLYEYWSIRSIIVDFYLD